MPKWSMVGFDALGRRLATVPLRVDLLKRRHAGPHVLVEVAVVHPGAGIVGNHIHGPHLHGGDEDHVGPFAAVQRSVPFHLDRYNASLARGGAADIVQPLKTAAWAALKRLALGLGLIALFSAILLFSDLARRNNASGSGSARVFKAAIVYFAPNVGTDICVQGLIDGLKASGFEEGKNLEVRITSAHHPTAFADAVLPADGTHDRFSRAETAFDRRFYCALAALLTIKQGNGSKILPGLQGSFSIR